MRKPILILAIVLFVFPLVFAACGPSQTTTPTDIIAAPIENPDTITSTSPTVPTTTTSAPDSPEYFELTFELEVPVGEEYNEYSFPIYIRNKQTLHLTWSVDQGDEILFIFLTPSNKYIGVRDGGASFVEGHAFPSYEGNISFRPLDYAWGEGYYEMKPHLATDSTHASRAKVKVRYWIED
jgi:hypothetical protein